MNINIYTFKENLLVFLLLFFSGNQIAFLIFGKYSFLVFLFLLLFFLKSHLKFDSYIKIKLFQVILIIIIISFLQYLTFQTLSYFALGNLILRIIIGGFIINSLKDRFVFVFFKVVSFLSIISLIGFLLINIIGFSLPYIQIGKYYKSFFFYGILDIDLFRNVGMFWEPGAFAGVLTLCLLLILNKHKYYWINYKFQLISIIISLLTTFSTTGYIIGFIIFLLITINLKNILFTFTSLSIFFIIFFNFFNNADFLKTKINDQLIHANNQRIGDFSNTRFGSLIFDWHYILKHPIVGNGFNIQTRYADHKFLFRGSSANNDFIGSGNAFSNYLASMGVIFILGYIILLWKASISFGKYFAFIFCLVIILNLQGEQWLDYPLYLGLPFISFKSES
jgi:hypothetical protein